MKAATVITTIIYTGPSRRCPEEGCVGLGRELVSAAAVMDCSWPPTPAVAEGMAVIKVPEGFDAELGAEEPASSFGLFGFPKAESS